MSNTTRFGWVALMGAPNAGKSTLMNHYLGQKVAIVSPKPQTTRNRISGILTRDDVQAVFLDTPGVHRLRGRMNKYLLETAWAALGGADIAVVLVDAGKYARKPELLHKELAPLKKPVGNAGLPVLIAVNKIDQVKDKKALLPVMAGVAEIWPEAEVFPISAKTGNGTDALLERIIKQLPEGFPMFPEDEISTVPMRFMASEVVREKLFLALQQELPYSTAVEIEHWEDDRAKNMVHIHAVIFTTRTSHKGIIIGKQGSMLKRIGKEARIELEEMLDCKVVLKLWVKVRSGWTEDVGFLRSLGLGE